MYIKTIVKIYPTNFNQFHTTSGKKICIHNHKFYEILSHEHSIDFRSWKKDNIAMDLSHMKQ